MNFEVGGATALTGWLCQAECLCAAALLLFSQEVLFKIRKRAAGMAGG